MLGKLKKRKRLRTHGFLKRSQSVNWKKVLRDRRRKGRFNLTPSYPIKFKNVNWKARLHIIAGWKAKTKKNNDYQDII
jgi:ribosomal protein L34